MDSKIDEMLEFLALDDNFHPIEEISEKLNIPSNVCKKIADFLIKYDLVQSKGHKLKINTKIRDLFVSRPDEGSMVKGKLALEIASSLRKTER